ncbi:nitroreductase family protein [Asticcacaulis sp. 201]|uniref:nitroreductase family protein n=1 Tax=Asticcacaulis sp. 201 TaxID=3028787 RepID=UPI002915CD4F|nr:nitroreductase family protein [Asticcacaulis sp. 201]MDV6330918.1 nitroreductase family protein [Asticcacaulis sp. 201]
MTAPRSDELGSHVSVSQGDKSLCPKPRLSVTDAIYAQQTVFDFQPQPVPVVSIHALLYAAVQAPTVQSSEQYAFAIVQGRQALAELSDWRARPSSALVDQTLETSSPPAVGYLAADDRNIFFNAGTLIVVYGACAATLALPDVWLAAGNLTLAACGMGYGTRIVVEAIEALNSPEWRRRLKVPPHLCAVAPIIVGVAAGARSETSRKAPDIVSWST